MHYYLEEIRRKRTDDTIMFLSNLDDRVNPKNLKMMFQYKQSIEDQEEEFKAQSIDEYI